MKGWVSGVVLGERDVLLSEKEGLRLEITKLRVDIDSKNVQLRKQQADRDTEYNGASYFELKKMLLESTISVPEQLQGKHLRKTVDLLNAFVIYAGAFSSGVSNAVGAGQFENWLHNIASDLVKYGLMDEGKSPSRTRSQTLRTTKLGNRFLVQVEKERVKSIPGSGANIIFKKPSS